MSANPIANIRLTSVRSDYFTVTLTVLVTPLHVTVILAVPFLIPLIVPLDDTVAIFLLPDLYVTFPDGAAFAVILVVLPTFTDADVLFSVRVGFLTVTLQVTFTSPHLAVMTALPFAFAVTLPVVLFTAATFGLLEVNVTFGASAPVTVAFSVVVFPLYLIYRLGLDLLYSLFEIFLYYNVGYKSFYAFIGIPLINYLYSPHRKNRWFSIGSFFI